MPLGYDRYRFAEIEPKDTFDINQFERTRSSEPLVTGVNVNTGAASVQHRGRLLQIRELHLSIHSEIGLNRRNKSWPTPLARKQPKPTAGLGTFK